MFGEGGKSIFKMTPVIYTLSPSLSLSLTHKHTDSHFLLRWIIDRSRDSSIMLLSHLYNIYHSNDLSAVIYSPSSKVPSWHLCGVLWLLSAEGRLNNSDTDWRAREPRARGMQICMRPFPVSPKDQSGCKLCQQPCVSVCVCFGCLNYTLKYLNFIHRETKKVYIYIYIVCVNAFLVALYIKSRVFLMLLFKS